MSINIIKQHYETKKQLRDQFDRFKLEIESLENHPVVKQYKQALAFYEKYKELEHQTDNEILDELINGDTSLEKESYFYYGNDFYGILDKNGEYFIIEPDPYEPENPFIRVAKYRSIKDPKRIVAIPTIEQEMFERTQSVIYPHTDNIEEDYQQARRAAYLQQFKKDATLRR